MQYKNANALKNKFLDLEHSCANLIEKLQSLNTSLYYYILKFTIPIESSKKKYRCDTNVRHDTDTTHLTLSALLDYIPLVAKRVNELVTTPIHNQYHSIE